jgi:hypothetical protein
VLTNLRRRMKPGLCRPGALASTDFVTCPTVADWNRNSYSSGGAQQQSAERQSRVIRASLPRGKWCTELALPLPVALWQVRYPSDLTHPGMLSRFDEPRRFDICWSHPTWRDHSSGRSHSCSSRRSRRQARSRSNAVLTRTKRVVIHAFITGPQHRAPLNWLQGRTTAKTGQGSTRSAQQNGLQARRPKQILELARAPVDPRLHSVLVRTALTVFVTHQCTHSERLNIVFFRLDHGFIGTNPHTKHPQFDTLSVTPAVPTHLPRQRVAPAE